MLQVLKIIAIVGTILTGLASLFFPNSVQGFTGLTAEGGRGITEIRTILGALFVGLGAAVLFINSKDAYQVLGITYLAMGVVRLVSVFIDQSSVSSNWISVVAEFLFGALLLL